MPRSSNRVREVRESLGIAQRVLAERIGLSRQSLSAIESARAEPSVGIALRLARALGHTTEELFGRSEDEPATLRFALAAAPIRTAGPRVVLARIDGRWVGHRLCGRESCHAADGILEAGSTRRGARARLLGAESELPDTVLVSGCAPALAALADRVGWNRGGPRVVWLDRSNGAAMAELRAGFTSMAGVHGAAAGSGNRSRDAALGDGDWFVVSLARWRAGLLVAHGNPLGIADASSAARSGARWVVRERGSGARSLLDEQLGACGLDASVALAGAIEAVGHLAVGRAVAFGAADVGMAIEPVAVTLGLGFIPIADERFDLVIPRASLAEPRIQRVLEVLASAAFRADVAALGGYDIRDSGDEVEHD